MEATQDNNPANVTVVFVAANGERTTCTAAEAMRLNARSGFTGRIEAAPVAARTTSLLLLTAAIVGFTDEDDGEVIVEEPVEATFYTDVDLAKQIHEWLVGEGGNPTATLLDLNGCAIYGDDGALVNEDGSPLDDAAICAALCLDDESEVDPEEELARREAGPSVTVTAPIAAAFGIADMRGVTVVPASEVEVLPRSSGPVRTVAPGTVSVVAQQRIREDHALLASIGIANPSGNYNTNPRMKTAGGYTPGTSVIALGYENLATARRRWENQPLTEDACTSIIEQVRGEQRRDFPVHLRDLAFDDEGKLLVAGEPLPFEINGFTTMVARIQGDVPAVGKGPIFPSAARYLLQLPVEERVWNLRRGLYRANLDDVLVLRTHVIEGQRQLYATVSEGYAPYDADKVCEAIRDFAKGKGFRGEAGYEAGSTDLVVEGTYHAPGNVTDFAAGDAFKVGFRFKSNDASGGSINGGGSAWWNECLNMIILSDATASFRIVHRGDMSGLVKQMTDATRKMTPVFEQFGKRWGILKGAETRGMKLWGVTVPDGRAALTHIVKEGKLDVPVNDDKLIKALHDAWERESITSGPDDTAARVLAAITRAAHETLLADCVRDTWERKAGILVPVLARFAAEA